MRALLFAVGLFVASSTAWAGELTIVLDPGHGGAQEGAVGVDGLREKELALKLSARLKQQLERRLGARVVLTRSKDEQVHLSDRVAFSNRHKPDLFISVHANSMPTQRQRERTEGIQTFFLSASASGEDAKKVAARENAEAPAMSRGQTDTLAFILADLQRSETHGESSRLAYAVHQRLVAHTQATDLGVQQAPFYVLMGVEAPAILIEAGFITHPTEGRRLADAKYQQAIADAVVEGVQAFLAHGRPPDSSPALARP